MAFGASACSFSLNIDSDLSGSSSESSSPSESSSSTPSQSSDGSLSGEENSNGNSSETSSDETPDESSSSSTPDESSSDETPDESTSSSTSDESSSSESSSDETPDESTSSSTPDKSSSDETPDESTSSSSPTDSVPDDETPDETAYDRIDIHFIELGNGNTGDCTYIKAGNTDILIDAGSRKGSAPTITSYLDRYCDDGKLEYVIATHADQDHIAAFVGSSGKGVFDVYRVGTVIDFPKTNKSTQILKDYYAKRDAIVENYGTQHYTALEWWNEENGLTRSIEIANGITMNVLYQKHYKIYSSDENNYSVCVLFSQGNNHYLFTGDLEESGEKSLVESNDLPQVQLFKAGHHGSPTSSNLELLEVIRPKIVCVCCCAGSNEYSDVNEKQFPSQAFADRVGRFTDQIFVTTMVATNSSGYASMNGNITVSSVGLGVTVSCSNNNTILKETEWFKANRTWPSNGV